MEAGTLRERVTIQESTETVDTQGGRAGVAATVATVWASVLSAQPGDEGIRTGAITAVGRYQVDIRYRADVTVKMRVLWRPYKATDAKILEIQSVSPIERVGLRLMCLEVAA